MQGIFEVALIKDVTLFRLDEKDHACRMTGHGGTVGVKCSFEASSETCGAVVGGEVE